MVPKVLRRARGVTEDDTKVGHDYIYAAKFDNSAFTQSSSTFKPVTNGALDGGMMGFMDLKLLT